ncbi:Ig-like domain-containing protein [Rudaea cellulosilytica]|uniref:Ig-like domain-containing protein n=1 Tax=Rudaea cellulosilytica TaxID=540746 RepID=UPI0003A9F189|nr:Ig-like domain-containing protein [Rudaea cellulosilytica]
MFALFGATSVFAQTYTYSIYVDADNSAATGCSVSLPGGNIAGAESVLTATINAGSPPQVAQVTRSTCAGGSFGAPVGFGNAAVSVGAGNGGTTSIELSGALASIAPGATTIRLYVVAQSTDGSDVLLTTTGAPAGAPILLAVNALPGQGAVPAPMIGIPAVLLLGMALLLIGSRSARRRMIKRLMLGLVLFSGIAGGAALFNWNGVAPLATDLAGDSSSGEAAIDLRYFFAAFSNNNVFFRFDVTGDLATPPPKPVAVPDTYNATINTPLNVSAPGVLANDTLNGGTISGHTNPTHGTLVFNADGSFVYTPTTGYTGQDSFNYTLTNAGGSSTALVNIVVLNGPAAEPDSYTTVVGTALNVSAPGVLVNDNLGNPNATLQSFGGGSLGGSVTTNAPGASVALGTSGGTLTLNANGSLSLTAPATAGTYTFLYRIGNVKGTSDATVTIQVNQPPSITSVGPANFSVGTNGTYTITTTGTPTVTSITLTGCTLPAGLSFSYTSGATATISGTATAPGTASCTVTASNGVSPDATQALVVNATAGPTVTAVSPPNGPTAGGTVVTITGANFTGATAVRFGATPATTFTVNLPTQITATAPAGSSGTVDVTVTTPSGTSPTGPADKFAYFGPPASIVVASGTPQSAAVGTAFAAPLVVTVLDASSNPVPGATVTFTAPASGASANLGVAAVTNASGQTQVTATANNTTGAYSVSASVSGVVTPATFSLTNTAAGATHFVVSAPATATAGTAFNFTVTALDQFNNTATGYAGTVHFTSTDGQAVLPADSTLSSGVGTFSATLKTVGSQTLTATDTVTASITGTSGAVTVSAAAATHYSVSAAASAIAGTAFNFTVTALDPFNNTATGYAGTVHFTSTDAQAVLPANSTLTNGVGTFSATLKTAGSQTLTATDTVTASITGTSNTIAVGATAATHYTVSAPASAAPGIAFNFTVTAQDQFNNTATGYAGTAHFTSTDGQAVLPADSTLTNGTGTFSATLKTVGSQTLTATDTVTASITGTSSTITVNAGAATHYTVSAPATATAGTAFNFTVTALDQFNNTATGYSGTAHFTSTDAQAMLPANSTLTNGVGTFSATLKTVGSQTLTATDTVTASITGTSGAVTVSAAAATHYSVSAPASAIAGTAFNFTVTALDPFNNTATGYAGTVHFTSPDGQAVLPANSTLTNGVGTFSATLKTAGGQTLTATDTVTAAITGTSNTITVGATAATHYSISAPASATAGTAFNFTVTALDPFNNTDTGYAGTAHFTSTDGQAVLPADSTLTNGTGTFSATLKTVGSQTLTATDTVTASITGTSGAITVNAGAATHYTVSAPATATAGTAFSFTVTALDQFNNTATGYAGTVHFTSTDAQAVLPADSTLTNGTGTFSATLKTVGSQTLTATDTVTASITGTSGTVTVNAAAATHFTVSAPASTTANTAFSFTVTALDQFNNTATAYSGTVHFTSTDAQAVLPANSTLTNGVGTFSATLKTGGNQTLTATDTVTASITGTSGPIQVQVPPQITSANSTTFIPGVAGTFSVTTTGFPTGASMLISEIGALPAGVNFVNNNNGTATLSGTPGALSQNGSPYALTITANNGIAPNATQGFTLNVVCPTITVSGTIADQTYNTAMSAATFSQSGGHGTITWTASGLAPGESIGAGNGQVTGTPTNTGTFTASVTATDAYGCSGSGTATYHVNPKASNDAYNALGNVLVNSANGAPAFAVTDNDSFPAGTTISAFDATSTGGGAVTMVTSGANIGQFTYDPPTGANSGTDTFTYTLSSNGRTATGTVTFAITARVWFINNTAGACSSTCDGRQSHPFTNTSTFQTANTGLALKPGANDPIFIYTGGSAYSGTITLLNGQRLIGQGASSTLSTLGAVFPQPGQSLPSTGGAAPNLTSSGTTITTGSGNFIHGLNLGNATTALAGTNFGTLTINSNVAINSNGQALNLNNGTLTATIESITSTGGANNIKLISVAGTSTFQHAGIGGALTGATGTAFLMGSGVASSGGTLTVDYDGTITASAGQSPVILQNRTNGTVTLNGAINSTALGVQLLSNTGATTALTGKLTLATGANAAFTATGGGTISATDATSTLTTTTGTALNVANTAIAAGNLIFKSISANGAVNGIVLNSTGLTGGLTVTGDGGAVSNGSGGTIQATTGDAILMTNVAKISLGYMNITNPGLTGIKVIPVGWTLSPANSSTSNGVTNFTLNRCNISDNAGSVAADDGLTLSNASGNVTLTNNSFNAARHQGVTVDNFSVNMASFTMTGNTVSNTPGGDGMLMQMRGTSVMTTGAIGGATAALGNTFSSNSATGLQIANADTGNIQSMNIQNNTISNNNAGTDLDLGQSSSYNITVQNNNFQNQHTQVINMVQSTGSTAGSLTALIKNNTIGTQGTLDSGSAIGSGIRVANGAVNVAVTIDSNQIREVPNASGIELGAQAYTVNGNVKYKIVNNTIPRPTGTNQAVCGPTAPCPLPSIFLLSDSNGVGGFDHLCTQISGNSAYDPSSWALGAGQSAFYFARRTSASNTLQLEGTQANVTSQITTTNTITNLTTPPGVIDENTSGTVTIVPAGTCGSFP